MDDLKWLAELHSKERQAKKEIASAEKKIRDGIQKRAIVFVDLVGSTCLKLTYAKEPEKWMLRLKRFSDILTSVITGFKGIVVKYIGDEVMASFENIQDAANLVLRVSEIEALLNESEDEDADFQPKIKVAVDYGYVYEFKFASHEVPDPQGSVVDRCARIAEYGVGGEVLSSESFCNETRGLNWQKVGFTELRGLGKEAIYQLKHVTISLTKSECHNCEKLKDKLKILESESSRLMEKCEELQQGQQALAAENSRLRKEGEAEKQKCEELREGQLSLVAENSRLRKESEAERQKYEGLLKKLKSIVADSSLP